MPDRLVSAADDSEAVAKEELAAEIARWRKRWASRWQCNLRDDFQPTFCLDGGPEFKGKPRRLQDDIVQAIEESKSEAKAPRLREIQDHAQELWRFADAVLHRGGGLGQLRVRWAKLPAGVRAALLDLDAAYWLKLPDGYADADEFIRRYSVGRNVTLDARKVALVVQLLVAHGAHRRPRRSSRGDGKRSRRPDASPTPRVATAKRGRQPAAWIDALVWRLGFIFSEFTGRQPDRRGAFPDLVRTVFINAVIRADQRIDTTAESNASVREHVDAYLRLMRGGTRRNRQRRLE